MQILLADKQDITRAGLQYVLHEIGADRCKEVFDKAELVQELEKVPDSLVILDYNLFDHPEYTLQTDILGAVQ